MQVQCIYGTSHHCDMQNKVQIKTTGYMGV